MGWVSLWEGSELSAPGAAATAVQLSDVGQAGEGETPERRGACVRSFLTLGTRETLPLGLRLDTRAPSCSYVVRAHCSVPDPSAFWSKPGNQEGKNGKRSPVMGTYSSFYFSPSRACVLLLSSSRSLGDFVQRL